MMTRPEEEYVRVKLPVLQGIRAAIQATEGCSQEWCPVGFLCDSGWRPLLHLVVIDLDARVNPRLVRPL